MTGWVSPGKQRELSRLMVQKRLPNCFWKAGIGKMNIAIACVCVSTLPPSRRPAKTRRLPPALGVLQYISNPRGLQSWHRFCLSNIPKELLLLKDGVSFADLVPLIEGSELEVVFIFGASNVMSTKRQWMHRRNENTNFEGKIYELWWLGMWHVWTLCYTLYPHPLLSKSLSAWNNLLHPWTPLW